MEINIHLFTGHLFTILFVIECFIHRSDTSIIISLTAELGKYVQLGTSEVLQF